MYRLLILLACVVACQAETTPIEDRDGGVDQAIVDGAAPDAEAADMAQPDMALPDMALPDMALPDADPAVECAAHADCAAAFGERGRCVGTADGAPNEAEPALNRCRLDLAGVGYRLTSAQLLRPDPGVVGAILNNFIARGDLALTVFFQETVDWPQGEDGHTARYLGWIFNADDALGMVASPRPDHPAIRADTLARACEGVPGTVCHDVISQARSEDGDAQLIELWLPAPEMGDACALQPLRLIATIGVTLNPAGGGDLMRVSGIVTPAAARAFVLDLPNQTITLFAHLNESGIAPTLDGNLDGLPESWEIAFEGPATEVGVAGNLAGAQDAEPCE